ncbi:unnamed protein product, partial [Allacma fusca]
QASPKADSFDRLQDAGRNHSRYGPGQRLLSDRSESDLDDVSDLSEMEQYPSPAPFPRRNSRTRMHHVQLDPKTPVDADEDKIMDQIRP